MSAFEKLAELPPIVLADGIRARAVKGERMTMAVVDLAPNAISPEHKHENEQLGFVIRGSMTMRIGDEVLDLHAGDTYVIPSHVGIGTPANGWSPRRGTGPKRPRFVAPRPDSFRPSPDCACGCPAICGRGGGSAGEDICPSPRLNRLP